LGRERPTRVHRHRRAGGAGDQRGLIAVVGGIELALADPRLRPDARAVAAAHDARVPAARPQRLDRGDDHPPLAGASDVDVADHDHGRGGAVGRRAAGQVVGAPPFDMPARHGGQRPQQPRQPAIVLPVALREDGAGSGGSHRAFWAAKLTRPMPARRAASMTLTTDWWVAWASALMTSTGWLLPAAASASAWAMADGSAASTSVPLSA